MIARLLRRGRRDISCEQAVALVTAYLEDALSAGERHVAEAVGVLVERYMFHS